MRGRPLVFFFFNDTATTEIYTLSLHDALPIWITTVAAYCEADVVNTYCLFLRYELFRGALSREAYEASEANLDRKSTRLNSSHANISYAVFCLNNINNHSLRLLCLESKLSERF